MDTQVNQEKMIHLHKLNDSKVKSWELDQIENTLGNHGTYTAMYINCQISRENGEQKIYFHIFNLYRIGFGSFSDKAMVPFAMEKSRYQAGNANGFRPTPYSFQHHLDLTDDVKRFTNLIKNIDEDKGMPSNVDSPESGLDAMAQAMLCPNIVKWGSDDVR